jgi:hypothetical protein
MKQPATIFLLSMLLIGCQSNEQKEPPSAKITQPKKANRQQVSVELRCHPCMYSPEEWGTANDRAKINQDSFWVEDHPKKRGPKAFGILSHIEIEINPPLDIREVKMATDFPEVPKQLPVYIQGSYPKEHKELLGRIVTHPNRWEYHPAYSVLYDVGVTPITSKMSSPTKAKLEAKAIQLLGKLLMPDTKIKTTIQPEDGKWIVLFERRFSNYTIYSDRPLHVMFDREGRARNIIMRRKPILEESMYPIRTPEEAFQLLLSGRFNTLYIEDFKPTLSGTIKRFIVTDIEIGYHEQHPTQPRLPLQPYYIFRNAIGQALYVPAVADPYIKR